MSPRASKKHRILEVAGAQAFTALGAQELQTIRTELQRQLGPADRTSLGYIASVLREAGRQVQFEDAHSDPLMPEPYAGRLAGVLEFHDLASAEQSLLKLDAIHREYGSAGDWRGARLVFALVKKGKLRAQRLAANPRVRESKRQEKAEIARWFQVWLETPDLFAAWLELRKSSEEFLQLFEHGTAEDAI